MSLFLPGRTVVLAGHGFGELGPYLLVNDVDAAEQYHVPVVGATFSLRRSPRRICVGRFDLETFEKSPCPMNVELLPDAKDTMCPACQEATGFNPSFYFAATVSPQQRAYNLTPHFAYLAYFSPEHVKAGISSETRGIERLLEQGARAARIVGRFANADDARQLEAAMCAQPGMLETMRASLKARLLVEERYDVDEATAVLDETAARLARTDVVAQAGFSPEEVRDLSPYYFGGPSPDVRSMRFPEGFEDECGGLCIGMVGGSLVFRQGEGNFVVSVKEWESHCVELRLDEVTCSYETDPQQTVLF